MKKLYFFYVFLFILNYLQAQSDEDKLNNLFNTIDNELQILKGDSLAGRDFERDSAFDSLYYFLKENLFTSNDNLYDIVEQRKMVLDSFIFYLYETRPNSSVKIMVTTFLASKLYRNLNDDVLYDTLIATKNYNILSNSLYKKDSVWLLNKYNNLSSCEELYDFLAMLGNELNFPFYKKYYMVNGDITKLRNCKKAYAPFINSFKRNQLAHPLEWEQERNYVLNDMPLDSDLALYIKNQIILEIPTRADSIAFENSLIRQQKAYHEWLTNNERERMKNDSISNERWKNDTSIGMLILRDTTLVDDKGNNWGQVIGNDGFRFDTFSNDALIQKLAQTELHEIYDTILYQLGLNNKKEVIDLRKIFQIIGDRYVYGMYVPSQEHKIMFNNMADFYANKIDSFPNYPIAREAIAQIMRLWTIVEDRHLAWLTDGREKLYYRMKIVYFYLLDEANLVKTLQQVETFYATGQDQKSNKILRALARMYGIRDLEGEPYFPSRRPMRSVTETKRLLDTYIIPVFDRYNFYY